MNKWLEHAIHRLERSTDGHDNVIAHHLRALAAPTPVPAPREAQPKLKVWYGSMAESNGKTNWTAILHRGDISEGITIDHSEYPDRVRYEADRMRWMIGELVDEPWILDYDADKHSGYAAPTPERADADTAGSKSITAEEFERWRIASKEHRDGLLANFPKEKPISDAMMDLVDRLGSEASEVDPRAWKHLLVYSPERADADTAPLDEATIDTLRLALGYIGSTDRPDRLEHVGRIRALIGASQERADAEKDAALTDEQIIEIFQDHYTEEPGDAEPGHILPFARAILAAKEKKS
jgi:hypothetical protein